jgi:hypothetical protein
MRVPSILVLVAAVLTAHACEQDPDPETTVDAAGTATADARPPADSNLPPSDASLPVDAFEPRPDVPRPDAALTCTLTGDDLGLTLSPFPAETTGGTLVAARLAPDSVALTVRDGGDREVTYTLTGPFADLPADALPTGARVSIQVQGGGFHLTAGPCGRAPFEVLVGTWPEVEALTGPLVRYDALGCGQSALCPRPFAHPIDAWRNVEPGQTRETLQRRITLGRNEGCPEDPTAASRLELVAMPRRDAPLCAGPGPMQRPPSFELAYTLPPPLDTPENRTRLDFEGEVSVELPPVAPGTDPVLRLVPLVTAAAPEPPTAIEVTWHAEAPFPAGPLVAPVRAVVRALDQDWIRGDAVELTDAQGLVFMAVRGDRDWVDRRPVNVVTRNNRPDCLSRVEDAPDVVTHWEAHALEFQFYEYEGQSPPSALPGDTVVEIGGRAYALDLRATHALPDACTTDAVSGWVDFALGRQP